MEEGIAWNKIDAYGNNNKRTYDLVDILMMGGSNIEAIHLSKKDNVTYLLDEDLKDYNVYSIGQSGHDIYTCVQNLEAACKKYTPKYVVMDISKEKLDIESMKMVLGGGKYPNQKIEKRMTIKILRNCLPAIANMVLHLKEWIALAPENVTDEVDDVIQSEEYDDILEQFLEYANETVSRHGAKLILLHYPLRYSFDENGKMSVYMIKRVLGC